MIVIEIEKIPKLKIVDSGHLAWVEGRIKAVDSLFVTLESDAQITLE